jgi:hypothetical protein
MNKKIIKNCIVCNRKFICNIGSKGSRENSKSIRKKNCLTCSHECSIIYLRKKDTKKFKRHIKRIGEQGN